MSSLPISSLYTALERVSIRKDAFLIPILMPLFALLYFREQNDDGPPSTIYDKALGGFRWIDLFIIFIILGTVLLAWRKCRPWPMPQTFVKPGILFAVALIFSIVYGWVRGGTNLFFDWRGIALLVGLVVVFGYWVNTPLALRSAVRVFLLVFAARAIWVLLNYTFGGGVMGAVSGVRTPLFDGSTLSISCLAAILSIRFSVEEPQLVLRFGYLLCALLANLLVIVCFRRTFWVELFVASVILFYPNRKLRLFGASVLIFGFLLAIVLVPGVFVERLKSFNLLEGDEASDYAETNMGHLGDLLDAWDQIQEHPITGIGQGSAYDTVRIVDWKTESWIVHNAALHVWLRYGIGGLIAYFWFHYRLLRWIRSLRNGTDRQVQALAEASFAYLTAVCIVSLGFAPWPYGETQSCIAVAFLVGCLLALQESRTSFALSAGIL